MSLTQSRQVEPTMATIDESDWRVKDGLCTDFHSTVCSANKEQPHYHTKTAEVDQVLTEYIPENVCLVEITVTNSIFSDSNSRIDLDETIRGVSNKVQRMWARSCEDRVEDQQDEGGCGKNLFRTAVCWK